MVFEFVDFELSVESFDGHHFEGVGRQKMGFDARLVFHEETLDDGVLVDGSVVPDDHQAAFGRAQQVAQEMDDRWAIEVSEASLKVEFAAAAHGRYQTDFRPMPAVTQNWSIFSSS